MRRLPVLLCLLMALCGTAFAAPPKQAVDRLFSQLKAAETPEDAKPIEDQILGLFQASGSPSVDLMMARADAALAAGNKEVAGNLYGAITVIAPGFAEGWHRRAMTLLDAGDDQSAMVALQRTVELNPRHFQAMMELGQMMEGLGEKARALQLYRRAVELDPYLEGLQRHIEGLTRDVEGQGI